MEAPPARGDRPRASLAMSTPEERRKKARAHYLEAQQIAFGPLMFQAARALRDMGVLQAVQDSGREGLTPEDASRQAQVSGYAARVLLEAGLSMKLVELVGGRYRCTRAGALVLHDQMTRVNMDFVHDVCFLGAFRLEDALREGKPAGLAVFGERRTIYEALAELPPHVQKSWFAFDHFYSDQVFPLALPVMFAENPRTVLDVGGNTGKWAVACAQHDPSVKVTILDHPGQLAKARANVAAAGVADRVDGRPIDLLDHQAPFPEDYDAVWMSQLLDCFPETDIVQLLRRGAAALSERGKLYVLDNYWDRQPNEIAAYCLHAMSLYFAVMANGTSRMYHSEEMLGCVADAGLVVEKDQHLGISHTLFTCVPKRA